MKKLLFLLLIPGAAFGQALSYLPPSIGLFYSSDGSGSSGTWNPLTGTGGSTPLTYLPPTMGMYYSNDGTGNIGTWVPCTSACIGGGGGGAISLTTTGTSGAATLTGTVLNVPVYAGSPVTFDQIGSGTNLGHGLVCGAGCVISATGGGFNNANEINGVLLSGWTPAATSLTFAGTTAGFVSYGQGSTNAAGTTNITEQAPAAVTSYVITKPGAAASGFMQWTNSAGVVTESITTNPIFATSTSSAASKALSFVNNVTTVTASATPALVATNGLNTITLNANSTPTISGIAAGQYWTIEICQPATGGPFTWTWPASIHGGATIGSGGSTCTQQQFASFSGTTLVALSPGVTGVAP